jgi:hypothetical protein
MTMTTVFRVYRRETEYGSLTECEDFTDPFSANEYVCNQRPGGFYLIREVETVA